MKALNRIFAFAIAAVLTIPVGASAQDISFGAYLETLKQQARTEGVSESTISRMTYDLTPNPRVIELDRGQPGTPTSRGFPRLQPYLDRHVESARIRGGRNAYASTRSTSRLLESEYGVPAEIIIAIWGHETNYGSYTGDFDLSRSLATLAWEGRRRELFSREFIDLLKVADKGVNRSTLKGSWAGAFGNPQFLPSVYLRLAADGDGDGDRDIWNSREDTLASIANYFRDAGWRQGQPWGVRASIPASLNRESIKNRTVSPVCSRVHERHSQWKTVAEWRELGVRPQKYLPDNTMVSLFEPDGVNEPAWLLTGNYRVILEYNCSNYYAMSVGLLADEIKR